MPVGWPWVALPGVVFVTFGAVAEPPAEGCPVRLAGPVGVPLDSRGVVEFPPAPDDGGVARGAGCPVDWSAGVRPAGLDDCDMTTATAIAAAAATAAIPAVTARRLENRARAGGAPGKPVAGKPAPGESAPRYKVPGKPSASGAWGTGRVTSAVMDRPTERSGSDAMGGAGGKGWAGGMGGAAASRSLPDASSNAMVVSSALPAADAQRSAQ